MNKGFHRRDVLHAGAGIVATSSAGCFDVSRDPGPEEGDTPSPTATPVPMQPFDASNAGIFQSVTPIEREIHRLVNRERTAREEDQLPYDPRLSHLGRIHARDMAERNYFAHTNPEEEGPSARMRKYGLDDTYRSVGENIARVLLEGEYKSAEGLAGHLVKLWKESDSHRAAMLDKAQDRHGTGVYVTENAKVFAAMELGSVDNRSY